MLPDNAPDPRRWKALALLCTAFFMVTLDASIVLGGLPSIDQDLGFADADLQWVMSAYGLTCGAEALAQVGGRPAFFAPGVAPIQAKVHESGTASAYSNASQPRDAQG